MVDIDQGFKNYNLDYLVDDLYMDYYDKQNYFDNNVVLHSYNIDHDPVNSVGDLVYVELDYNN